MKKKRSDNETTSRKKDLAGAFMGESLERQIKVRFTENEREQLEAIALHKSVKLSQLIREIVLDRLRTNLSHGERLQLTATRELHQLYKAAMMAALEKQLTPAKLSEIESAAKLQRPELLFSFMEEMGA
jgi:hypothetical protein